jgi:hypothetical protein
MHVVRGGPLGLVPVLRPEFPGRRSAAIAAALALGYARSGPSGLRFLSLSAPCVNRTVSSILFFICQLNTITTEIDDKTFDPIPIVNRLQSRSVLTKIDRPGNRDVQRE